MNAIRVRFYSELNYALLTEGEYEELLGSPKAEQIAETYRFGDPNWEECTGINYAGQRIQML